MEYQVIMLPVAHNNKVVFRLLLKFLGPNNEDKVERLIKNGGTILQHLDQKAANSLAAQFRKSGAHVRVSQMKTEESHQQFLVRLLALGKNEIGVIKLVHDLTKLSLKEAKEIVNRLGVVVKNISKKEAENIRKMLEAAGAKVQIEEMSSSEPDHEPEPQPDLEDSNTVYGKLTDKDGQPLIEFSITLREENIRKWLAFIQSGTRKEEK